MNLDFSDEQNELGAELARLLAARDGRRTARAALEGGSPYDAALWRELGELGWLSASLPEQVGGQGLGYEMLCRIALEIGRSMASVPIVSSIFLAAEALVLFGSMEQKDRYLRPLAAGERVGALAIAEHLGPLGPDRVRATVSGGELHGHKSAVADGMIADLLVVVARADDVPGLFLVDPHAAGVTREARMSIDPSYRLADVRFDGVGAEPLATSDWSDVHRLLIRAAVPIAFEQLGAADAALDMSVSYAKDRWAFGRPVGSFQAIKHKLADVWIANELARSNAYYAAWALAADAPELPLAAATARVSANEALERASRELIQVHGGIGATWEHDAHLFYRRAQQLSLMVGGTAQWAGHLVDHLTAAR
jgi:acyl-CoA dehydrogenase